MYNNVHILFQFSKGSTLYVFDFHQKRIITPNKYCTKPNNEKPMNSPRSPPQLAIKSAILYVANRIVVKNCLSLKNTTSFDI